MKNISQLLKMLILVLAMFNSNVSAQNIPSMGPDICFGIKSQKINNSSHFSPGGKIGIKSTFPVNKSVIFAPGLYYANKGYQDNNVEEGLFGPWIRKSSSLSLNYLDLTLPVRISLNSVLYFEAGLQAGCLLHAEYKIYNSNDLKYKINVTDKLNRFDLGAIAGFGFQYKSGFGMSFMFNTGLMKINSDKTPEITSEFNNSYSPQNTLNFGRNFLGTFGIHYLFTIKDNETILPVSVQ